MKEKNDLNQRKKWIYYDNSSMQLEKEKYGEAKNVNLKNYQNQIEQIGIHSMVSVTKHVHTLLWRRCVSSQLCVNRCVSVLE